MKNYGVANVEGTLVYSNFIWKIMNLIKTPISEDKFKSVAQSEKCSACLEERIQAVTPSYVNYLSSAQDMFSRKTYPPWRTNQEATQYIGAYEIPKGKAFPISYIELSKKTHLFKAIPFDVSKDYFKTDKIIVFYCESCEVHVVKDGNHRLLQCALSNFNPVLDVYEVVSKNWSKCKVDMKKLL